MKRILFLDLEDTVISPIPEGWSSFFFINMQKVRDVIELFKPDEVHIFSFAVQTPFDIRGFDTFVRLGLEEQLGVKIKEVPCTDLDIFPVIVRAKGLSPDAVTFHDISDFWSKHESFRIWLRAKFKDTHAVFLDDAVFNESFQWKDENILGDVLNIDNLIVDAAMFTKS